VQQSGRTCLPPSHHAAGDHFHVAPTALRLRTVCIQAHGTRREHQTVLGTLEDGQHLSSPGPTFSAITIQRGGSLFFAGTYFAEWSPQQHCNGSSPDVISHPPARISVVLCHAAAAPVGALFRKALMSMAGADRETRRRTRRCQCPTVQPSMEPPAHLCSQWRSV
jgi:hypothetical protein